MPSSLWITGQTQSGKTTQLLSVLTEWGQHLQPFPHAQFLPADSRVNSPPHPRSGSPAAPLPDLPPGQRGVLVFAANGDNRIALAEAILDATQGRIPFDSASPLGFFETELNLFWPLVANAIGSTVPLPLRLRPETEQELATRLWQAELDQGQLQQDELQDYYIVRRTLDLMQLAASAGIPLADLPSILADGFGAEDPLGDRWDCMGELLQRWASWCLDHGFLTYGLISDLYGRVLLPHPVYQRHLCQRYRALCADDVDEYPAIAHQLFTILLDHDIPGVFTTNPNGGIRLGLGADPNHMAQLAERCTPMPLPSQRDRNLSVVLGNQLWQSVVDPLAPLTLPDGLHCIHTVSRAELLRQIADVIHHHVSAGTVAPQDIAIIGPGVDAIARYALREMLGSRDIAVESLNEQQAIASTALVRALLTLMGLVYPGLGRLIRSDDVAEMLIVLSERPDPASGSARVVPRIDPVRAGLIVDHCFQPDPLHPELLPVESFPRWDRLGYQGTQAYRDIRQWVQVQTQQQAERLLPNPVTLLDRAIQYFLLGGSHLSYDRLSVLRELTETAQHYWQVDARLRQRGQSANLEPMANTVGRFIQLLRDGTITADPYPTRAIGQAPTAITLATLFQYRSARLFHPWQFWLDAGSALWLTGGEPLFGAPLLLHQWSGRRWTEADAQQASQERLRRNMLDLVGRTGERLYLCHSDLSTGGYEQAGPLLAIVNRADPMDRVTGDRIHDVS